MNKKLFLRATHILAVALTCLSLGSLSAQAKDIKVTDRYKPALGITPDGCQVWLIDDGIEGYAWNRTDRDGKPICVETAICFDDTADHLFVSGGSTLRPEQRERLTNLFKRQDIHSYAINGYTDSSGSYDRNMELSKQRATAVAQVALAAGAQVTAVRALGEQYPRATNSTAEGRALNRRVEVFCHRKIGEY
ncbi:OmpA family protein [Falsihalocynthiibacter sp. SS001]|uniref:OmpA family protein n=1 Tax=Falsihalocynthiibacter sp. SS001 TaxID=3349698 RepID=UPI0036D23994